MSDRVGDVLGLLMVVGFVWLIIRDIAYKIRYRPRQRMLWGNLAKYVFVPTSVRNDLELKWLANQPAFTGPLRRLIIGQQQYTKSRSAVGYLAVLVGERSEIVCEQFYRHLTERGWSAQASGGGWEFRDGNWRLVLRPRGSSRYDTYAELWREDTAQAPAAGEGER